MSREDQARVTVFVGKEDASGKINPWPGLGDLGIWENRTGGDGDTDSTKHREGNMGQEKSFGGPQTTNNVSVSRRYDLTRDHPFIKALYAARGKAILIVTEQPLDEYGAAFGDPLSWRGKLKGVNPGDRNANSNSIKMVTLEQDTEGDPA